MTDEKARFEAYLRDLPDQLAALERDVGGAPLDRSYASLDRVEDAFARALDGGATEAEAEAMARRIGCYVGATWVANAGAKWDYARTKEALGLPSVANLPGFGKTRALVMYPVRTFARSRGLGWLRDTTELHDLPRRRATLAGELASLDDAMEGLRADVSALLGDDAPLDVQRVEAAVAQLLAQETSRDTRRRVRERAVLFVGTVVQRALASGGWEVCANPRDAELGQFETLRFAPVSVMRALRTDKLGHLQRALDLVIAARR